MGKPVSYRIWIDVHGFWLQQITSTFQYVTQDSVLLLHDAVPVGKGIPSFRTVFSVGGTRTTVGT